MAEETEEYSASNIQVLEGLEAVRKRPAMYIGDISAKGLHHLVYEVVDNSIDEALAGFARHIDVTINADNSITVVDDGRGIPVDMHEKEHKSALEVVLTVLHAGGKFDKGSYKVSGGLHGVGVSCVNALSTYLRAEVHRDGKAYMQEYSCGKPTSELTVIGTSDHTGTMITFKPDASIFTTTVYDYDTLANRLRDLAYLNAGITLHLSDMRNLDAQGKPRRETFHSKDGLREFVQYIDSNKESLINDVIHLNTERQGIPVEVALTYNNTYNENIYSFVNNINTIEGGTHLTGFRRGLTLTLKKYAEDNNLLKNAKVEISSDDFREGLTAVISVKVMEPQFEGQTKTKLGNPEAKNMVENLLTDALKDYFNKVKKDVTDAIFNKAAVACKARENASKAKEVARRMKGMSNSELVGKLAGCSGRKAELNELFIVEGDSAGGSAKQGRDRSVQAILPLKGKPLNTEKKSKNGIVDNEELMSLINALGTGFDKDFDIKGLKYNKVIILADADQDGAHIRSILLTFFFRYMRQLIIDGHVYIGMPPLYKITEKNVVKYAYDDNELTEILKDCGKNYTLQRYKGLGEMNPEQLWETTLNPATRTLMRVTIEDAATADKLIDTLMGADVEPRKQYIYEYADFNKVDKFKELSAK